MKIIVEKYNPEWVIQYNIIKSELTDLIGFVKPDIEHIGSTSVEGLSAKPIIDILIGVKTEDELERVIIPLIQKGYVYYETYNKIMPYRRFFVKHKEGNGDLPHVKIISDQIEIPVSINEYRARLAHIHVLIFNSEHWIRHIAFRDYLKNNPLILKQYQTLKQNLSNEEWKDVNEYHKAKDEFLKREEKKAIKWFESL